MPGLQETAAAPAEPGAAVRKRRIVLTTLGSPRDLHPYIAVALGLKARGHEAVIATSECYRQKVEALGLGFRAVRPDYPAVDTDADLMPRMPASTLRNWENDRYCPAWPLASSWPRAGRAGGATGRGGG
jgi:UDP:flavonoid glycosyltransferase YjiC (YdhE family)